MWIQIKPADWLKGYFQAFFLFFTNNISTTSLWKYILNQKSIGTGPARPAFHSGIRTHRHEHPVISLRGLIGPDSVAVEKLSRKTLTLELSAGPRFQIANILKNIVCNFQTARWSDFQWVWVIPCKWSITEYWAVSKLQLFAASQLKRHFSKQKLVLVLPVSQIPVMSAEELPDLVLAYYYVLSDVQIIDLTANRKNVYENQMLCLNKNNFHPRN